MASEPLGIISAVLQSAAALRALANSYDFLAPRENETQEEADAAVNALLDKTGELIASATSLTLALELYLKALLMANGLQPPREHKLDSLFKRLPVKVRNTICEKHSSEVAMRRLKDSQQFIMEIYMGKEPEKGAPFPVPQFQVPGDKAADLKSVLRRNKNAYQTWRYVHETGSPNQWVPVRYEWGALNLACEVIKEHINNTVTITVRRGSKRVNP